MHERYRLGTGTSLRFARTYKASTNAAVSIEPAEPLGLEIVNRAERPSMGDAIPKEGKRESEREISQRISKRKDIGKKWQKTSIPADAVMHRRDKPLW